MRIVLALGLCLGLAALSAPAVAADAPAYKLFSDDAGPARRVLSVRVDQRLSDADLGRIAETVKARAQGPAGGRTVVKFYLGHHHADEIAWATATFAPDMKLVLNGLSLEEAELLTQEARQDKRAQVGSWLMGPPAAAGRLTIYREKGRAFAEWRLRGGHRTVDELAEARWNGGSRFDVRGDDTQHYVVTRAGVLELRDKSKLIVTVERIEANAPQAHVASAQQRIVATAPVAAEAKASETSVVVRAVPIDAAAPVVAKSAPVEALVTPLPSRESAAGAVATAAAVASVVAATPANPPSALATPRAEPAHAVPSPAAAAPAVAPRVPAKQAAKPRTRHVAAAQAAPTKTAKADSSVAALMAAKFGQR